MKPGASWLASLLALLVTPALADSTFWRSDWLATGQTWRARMLATYTDTGEVILASDQQSAAQVIRLDATGAIRWISHVNADIADSYTPVLSTPDGGAVLADYEGVLFRLDASGQLKWRWPGIGHSPSLVVATPDSLVSAQCVNGKVGAVTSISLTTGRINWQRSVSDGFPQCYSSQVSVDTTGNIYASFASYSAAGSAAMRVSSFSSDGTLRWAVDRATANYPRLFAPSSGKVYLWSSAGTVALHDSNGTLAWSLPISAYSQMKEGITFIGAASDPVLVGFGGIRRISSADASTVWTASKVSAVRAIIADGDVVVEDNFTNATRLDANSGEIKWARQIAQHPWLYHGQIGRLGDSIVEAMAYQADEVSGDSNFDVFARVRATDGSSQHPTAVPETMQAVIGNSTIDGNRIFQAGMTALQDQFLVRSLETDTGVVDWQFVVEKIPARWKLARPNVASAGTVVVAAAELSGPHAVQEGGFAIAALDRVSGVKRWQLVRANYGEEATRVSAPAIDTQGNAYVMTSDVERCHGNPWEDNCYRLSLYKFDNVTGSVHWRRDEWTYSSRYSLYPPEFALIDDDAIVQDGFGAPPATARLKRISGSDGASVIWTSESLGDGGGVELWQANSARITTQGFDIGAGLSRFTEIDPATGEVRWSSYSSPICASTHCATSASVFLSNSDAWFGGYDSTSLYAWTTRVRLNGDGKPDRWTLPRPDLLQRSSVLSIIADPVSPDGAWMAMSQHWTYYGQGSLWTLSRLDPSHVGGEGRQALTLASDQIFEAALPNYLLRKEASSVLLSGPTEGSGHGMALSAALVDTTVSAHGDLSVSVDFDRRAVSPGQRLRYLVNVSYLGDAPIEGVKLLVHLPWQSDGSSQSCVVNGASHCTFTEISGPLQAIFDIAPGGYVSLSGLINATQIAEGTQYIGAIVAGPTGLLEADTENNLVSARVGQSLFVDGFEVR
ncbi:MAG: hypothetical protein ABI411_15760 [Tahibacter sp.]